MLVGTVGPRTVNRLLCTKQLEGPIISQSQLEQSTIPYQIRLNCEKGSHGRGLVDQGNGTRAIPQLERY